MHKIIPGCYGMFGQYPVMPPYYNMRHTHHKHESLIKRMYNALKSWHYKHTTPSLHDRVSAANRTLVRTNVRDNLR